MSSFHRPNWRREFILLGAVLWFATMTPTASCQPESRLPVPEFYGIYAASNGHLIKLDGNGVRTERTASVRIGKRSTVSQVLNGEAVASSQTYAVPVFAPDMKIIVYSESSGMMTPLEVAEPLRIEPLVFVRNVSVDTGFPKNIRRSGPENGWEYGTAPEMLGLVNGDHPEPLELLKKPFPGHKDMVIAGVAGRLAPGVYRFTLQPGSDVPGIGGGNFFTFAVEPIVEAESAKCVDSTVTYAMMISNVKYGPCGSARPLDPEPNLPEPKPIALECSDYDACMSQGKAASARREWANAVAFCERATKQRPESLEAWECLAKANEKSPQPRTMLTYWDNILHLGGTVTIPVCHEKGMKRCEEGTVSLSPKEVSFTTSAGQRVLSAAPSEVTAKLLDHSADFGHVSFNLQIQKKNNNFDVVPVGLACEMDTFVKCPPDGTAQQLTVSTYIFRTVARFAGQSQR